MLQFLSFRSTMKYISNLDQIFAKNHLFLMFLNDGVFRFAGNINVRVL